jgi:hypothetical protein
MFMFSILKLRVLPEGVDLKRDVAEVSVALSQSYSLLTQKQLLLHLATW